MTDTPYMLPADILADVNMAALSTADPVGLAALIAEFEDLTERYRGVAFTTRTYTQQVWMPTGTMHVVLDHPEVQSLTSLSVNGSAQDITKAQMDTTAGVMLFPWAAILLPSIDWPWTGSGDVRAEPSIRVDVTYTHGLATPPALLRACKQYVRSVTLAERSTIPRDVISEGFAGGGYTRYSTPDWSAGRPTGFIDVDRVLNALPDYRSPMVG